MRLAFETTLQAAEAREALWQVFKARLKPYSVLGLIVFGGLTLFKLQRPWHDSWDLASDLISYAIGIAIAMAALWLALLYGQSARAARLSQQNGPIKYVVHDDGIDIQANNVTAQLKWPAFAEFMVTKNLILLRLQRRRPFVIIPKRCLVETAARN